ncbi:DUF2147 domain-containing protein [Phenylobacterium sp.]|uniref:DUF2147 domain-containing protein n=1 Tax=Phenylobacterium sp. TaxID=1871053 RepID=UPI00286A8EC6|nr:DUF2147 domain-containing protein [Phenylobacterium sp.]
MISRRISLLAAFVLALAPTMSVAAPASPQGRFLTASGNVEVQIQPCGAALCGDVVRVLANRSMSDQKAPAAAAPAGVGLRLISDLKPSGAEWQGKIFNREDGKTYDCIVRPLPNGNLEVRPYVGTPLIGKTQNWTRVPAPAAAR